jgi:drug/metabolite transporter superfamily protein YnfA
MISIIPLITIVVLFTLSFLWTRYRKSFWFLILNFLILAVFANDISRTPENHYADLFLIILAVFNIYRYFRDRER